MFHSNFEGDANELELADEVEFYLTKKTNKVSAEMIRRLPRGSVAPEDVLPGSLNGKVIRSLRIVNPDQDEYPGQVQVVSAGTCSMLAKNGRASVNLSILCFSCVFFRRHGWRALRVWYHQSG